MRSPSLMLLRLRFVGEGESLRQYAAVAGDWAPYVVDLSQEAEPVAAAMRWMRADMAKTVDLREDALFAYAVLRVAADRVFCYQRCHHVALDGYSGSIVTGRVAEIYNALLRQEDFTKDAPPPLSVLLDADEAYRASADLQADRDYWNSVLASPPQAVSISGLRPAGIPRSLTRDMQVIPSERAADLRAAARKFRTSLSGLAITAAAAYLHRCTGAEDIVLGVPAWVRAAGEQRRVPGMTANVLPIRLAVRPGMPLGELARQVSAQVRQGLRHQRYRYEDILRDLRLVGRQGLCSLMLIANQFDYIDKLGDCSVRAHALGGPNFNDLTISVFDRTSDGSIDVAFDANPELYSAETTTANAKRFLAALDWIADASPDERLGRVPILDEAERHRILAEWNDTARDVPAGDAAGAVRGAGGADAGCGGGGLRGRRGDVRGAERAGEPAGAAAGGAWCRPGVAGRGRDGTVGRPGDGPAGGVKAGGAYLPVDPEYPAERVGYMLADAAPVCVVTTRDVLPRLGGAGSVVVLDDPDVEADLDRRRAEDLSDADRTGPLLGSHPAYVIYTSGSTGRPKGVVVAHAGVVNRLAWMQGMYPLGAGDRVLQKTPFGFDVSVWELFWPLAQGCAMVVARPGGHRDPAYLAGLIRGERVTVAHFVPSMLQVFLAEESAGSCTGLRTVFCSGEALPAELAGRFAGVLPAPSCITCTARRRRRWTSRRGRARPAGGP